MRRKNQMSSRLMNHEKYYEKRLMFSKRDYNLMTLDIFTRQYHTLEERVQEINKQIEDNKLDEPIDEPHDG